MGRDRGRVVVLALSFLVTGGCGVGDGGVAAQVGSCRVAQQLVSLPDAVSEASGAAPSRVRPGVVWTHNDSGGEVVLYGVEVSGQLAGQITLEGAQNVDWEDVTSGACADGDCLYVADIGDNGAERNDATIYRLREPTSPGASTVAAEPIPIRYPTGPRDAEAIFVLPGERLYVVTKGENSAIEIFRYPGELRPGAVTELELVRRLSEGAVPQSDRVTGASASPDGRRVALRTLRSVLLYDAEALVSNASAVPVNVDVSSFGEGQGEGVAYGPNGALILVSEGAGGSSGTLGILWCP